MFHYYVLNHKGCVMLLNFQDVRELKFIENALYYYKWYIEDMYDYDLDDSTFAKYQHCRLLIEKFAQEIKYYDTSEQKD